MIPVRFLPDTPGQAAITDGVHSLAYAEVAESFALLGEQFAALSISPADLLALECSNSVACARALLFLLESGFSVALLPSAGMDGEDQTTRVFTLLDLNRVRHGWSPALLNGSRRILRDAQVRREIFPF